MTLLEHIARAICLSDSDSAPYSCECISHVECADTLAAARSVLASIEASGCVVVPKEPTDEMRDAFWRAMFETPPDESGPVVIGAGYDAMLSVRPNKVT